jgi:hypothetical protein
MIIELNGWAMTQGCLSSRMVELQLRYDYRGEWLSYNSEMSLELNGWAITQILVSSWLLELQIRDEYRTEWLSYNSEMSTELTGWAITQRWVLIIAILTSDRRTKAHGKILPRNYSLHSKHHAAVPWIWTNASRRDAVWPKSQLCVLVLSKTKNKVPLPR